MNYFEFFGIAVSLIGCAFGFGKQSNQIATLKRDTSAIAELHRTTLSELRDIKIEIASIKKDIEYLTNK